MGKKQIFNSLGLTLKNIFEFDEHNKEEYKKTYFYKLLKQIRKNNTNLRIFILNPQSNFFQLYEKEHFNKEFNRKLKDDYANVVKAVNKLKSSSYDYKIYLYNHQFTQGLFRYEYQEKTEIMTFDIIKDYSPEAIPDNEHHHIVNYSNLNSNKQIGNQRLNKLKEKYDSILKKINEAAIISDDINNLIGH